MSEADREKAINAEIAAIEKENNGGGKYTVSVRSFSKATSFTTLCTKIIKMYVW